MAFRGLCNESSTCRITSRWIGQSRDGGEECCFWQTGNDVISLHVIGCIDQLSCPSCLPTLPCACIWCVMEHMSVFSVKTAFLWPDVRLLQSDHVIWSCDIYSSGDWLEKQHLFRGKVLAFFPPTEQVPLRRMGLQKALSRCSCILFLSFVG